MKAPNKADTGKVNPTPTSPSQHGGLARILTKLRRETRVTPVRAKAWLQDRLKRGRYPHLSPAEVQKTRKSETIFIFGSGYSINDIAPEEWTHFAQHDTFGFNFFVRQNFVRVDYHLVREVGGDDLDPQSWRPHLDQYAQFIHDNPFYEHTIFIVQSGWPAINGNRMIHLAKLPDKARVFRFKSKNSEHYLPPSRSFEEGLVHHFGTLTDCVNFAYLLGWRKIVLVGVDLYDRRYFWLGYNETRASDSARGKSYEDVHNTAQPVINVLGEWHDYLAAEGITLSVYNPRSLLKEVMPVYVSQAQGEN